MRRTVLLRALVALAILGLAPASLLVATERSAANMTAAATGFLASLSAEQRQQAVFTYADSERLRWNFIPNEMFPRKGLSFRTMTPAQKDKAHALLKSGLSQKGYMTATAIIALEDTLRAIENSPRFARSPLDYQFTVFGTPGSRGTWGWRVEGHHLSLHFAVANGRVAATSPTFTGSNPATVKDGPQKGLRVLAPLEDLGRTVIEGLSAEQRTAAIVADVAPNDIVSGNKNNIGPLAPAGVSVGRMTPAQRESVQRLITAYTSLMADDLADERMARVRAAGLERVTFAWAGPTSVGAKHYYRVQGPTFLIEYDNTQNDGNHIHAVWRDFQGDFGRDVLGEHLRDAHGR
ncbi:MAG: DUF3500 domain-containing protein [Vicinamibacterales bacterium]